MSVPVTCADLDAVDCCDTCRNRGDGIAVFLPDGREAELCCNHAGGNGIRAQEA